MTCINKKHPEFQTLVNRSGLSESTVEAYSRYYMEEYGRFPYLDELPNSNSEPHLKESLKINSNGVSKISDIIEYTGIDDINQSVIKINDEYRDIETSILPLNKGAIVNITKRPNPYNLDEVKTIDIDKNVNSAAVFNDALNKLGKLYGINIIKITTSELMSGEWKDKIPDAKHTNAFVYGGNIYLNVDTASVDAPLHEMMHLFLGSIRYSDPNLYQQLVESIGQNQTLLERYGSVYKDRTRNDLCEEILVSEFSKYVVGKDSELSNLSKSDLYNIMYNINRVLDSILMGTNTTKEIPKTELINMSLRDIAKKVNSSALNNTFTGSLDLAEIHRITGNTKTDLMRKGELKEYCD